MSEKSVGWLDLFMLVVGGLEKLEERVKELDREIHLCHNRGVESLLVLEVSIEELAERVGELEKSAHEHEIYKA